MINAITEAGLDAYLTTWLKNKYPHLLSPWFQATILSVIGASPPYTVTLQRLGEPSGDGGEYVVANTGYTPQVGDNVECIWRDASSAYVMWPLNNLGTNAQQSAYSCIQAREGGSGSVGVGFNVIACDTIIDDPQSMSLGLSGFPGYYVIQIKEPGVYLMLGITHMANAGIPLQTTIQYTPYGGSATWTYGTVSLTGSGTEPGSSEAIMQRCQAGDQVVLGAWVGSAETLAAGRYRCLLSVVRLSS